MKKMKKLLSPEEIDRIIGMAWEDRTTFDAIQVQFELNEKEVIQLMKSQMTDKNWKKWRERVQGKKTKHAKLTAENVLRFKSKAQSSIAQNRISKKKY